MSRRLFERKISKAVGGGLVHLNLHTGPDDRDEYGADEVPCCMGGAFYGPRGCDCWEPVYDLEQSDDLQLGAAPAVRTACCHDCAYRNGSPERTDGYGDELVDVATEAGSRFYCHAGMRRVVAYRHPDGRELPASDGDYDPPEAGGVAFNADGTPAELCAGWAAHRQGATAAP